MNACNNSFMEAVGHSGVREEKEFPSPPALGFKSLWAKHSRKEW